MLYIRYINTKKGNVMDKQKTKAIGTTLKKELIEKLDILATNEGVSRSFVIQKLLEKEINKYIDKEKKLFNI